MAKQLKNQLLLVDYMRRNPNLTMTEYCRELKLTKPRYYRLIKFSREFYGDEII